MAKSATVNPQVDVIQEVVDSEYYHYEDTGCEVTSSCLVCPLSRCRYDDPAWYQRLRRAAKDMRVWRAVESEGLTAEEAAVKFSVTERTIFRMISRCKEALLDLDKEEVLALVAD